MSGGLGAGAGTLGVRDTVVSSAGAGAVALGGSVGFAGVADCFEAFNVALGGLDEEGPCAGLGVTLLAGTAVPVGFKGTLNVVGTVTSRGGAAFGGVSTFCAWARKTVSSRLFRTSGLQSPVILERSGIGRKDVLEKAGIPVKLELPGLGENLQEHIVGVTAYGRSIYPFILSRAESSSPRAQGQCWMANV